MNIELLDTFLDLSETRNFNRTAERLGVTQSTVSSRLRMLERMLDKQLFVRGKSGTEPTASGRRFQELARSLKLSWLDARREIQSIEAFGELIRVGIANQMHERVLGKWLDWVQEAMPKLALYIEVDYADQMILDLTRGGLDLAVLYSPRHLPDMHYEQIAEEKYIMVSSRPAHLKEIKLADYIKANYSIPFTHMHKQLLPELEHTPLSVGNVAAVTFLLSSRGGAAYLTHSVAEELQNKDIVFRVTDAPAISHPIYSAVHVRHRHSHVHRRLLQALKLTID